MKGVVMEREIYFYTQNGWMWTWTGCDRAFASYDEMMSAWFMNNQPHEVSHDQPQPVEVA